MLKELGINMKGKKANLQILNMTSNIELLNQGLLEYEYCVFYDNPENLEVISISSKFSKNILFVLMENEREILNYFNINSKETKYSKSMLAQIQTLIEEKVNSNFLLYQSSIEAYKSYINCYALSSLNKIRNADKLEFDRICLGFGVSSPLFFSIKEK